MRPVPFKTSAIAGVVVGIAFAIMPTIAQDDFGADIDNMFNEQAQRIDDIYDAVDLAIDRAYEGLSNKIEVDWPDGALPDRKRWVTYSEDLSSRVIADFEQGEFVVETLVKPGESASAKVRELMAMSKAVISATPTQLNQQDILLTSINDEIKQSGIDEEQVKRLTESMSPQSTFSRLLPTTAIASLASAQQEFIKSIDARPKPSVISEPESEIEPQPQEATVTQSEVTVAVEEVKPAEVVKIDTPEASKDKPKNNVADEAKSKANNSGSKTQPESSPQAVVANINKDIETQSEVSNTQQVAIPVIEVVEEDGQQKIRMSMAFVNDFQKRLVGDYLDEITQYAKRYDIPVSVVLAIIETESSFNPRAVSPIPAFGLMQLVPKTAGVDAHLLVYGEKKVVSPDFLFDEQNNLLLGSAYFHILTKRYLRKIEDPQSRFYCAVASYNTGVGNLAITFVGRKNINMAVAEINKMNSDQVYDYLLENLPAQETRNYLKKVVSRMDKYKQFDA